MSPADSIGRQLAFDFGHRPSLGGEDFLVAPCNEAAVAWIDAWPNWPAPALVIHGPPGGGKTHLAGVWRARAHAIEIPASSVNAFDAAAALGDAQAAVVEDADSHAAEGPFARGLFHLYNLLAERRGHLLLTARAPVAQWPLTLADLRSRLQAAPAAAIELPDEGLTAALLVKLFADRQLKVGDDVLAYLLARMERSFDAAHRLVAAIDAAALDAKRNVSVPLAGEVLAKLGPSGHGSSQQE
ncbi:MAG TPA: DnaA/Hda family protein [Alphaproteobacteria bacterium]|nr:DnaA/Hda family protein [Alphaproteobacteria bacterium]